MVSPHGTDSSRDWKEGIFAPATLMRLAAGAGREAQERIFIIQDAEPGTPPDLVPPRTPCACSMARERSSFSARDRGEGIPARHLGLRGL
jgi:hypothetical protein